MGIIKQKVKKKYVAINHRMATYRKIAKLKQGKMNVAEYIDELEKLSLMGDIDEVEEQKMSRFLRGFNLNIVNIVDLYPYSDFDTLCGLCLKLENQEKYRKTGVPQSEFGKSKSWGKPENATVNPFSVGSSSEVPKTATPSKDSKETSFSKVRCYKCQGFRHFQSSCPNK